MSGFIKFESLERPKRPNTALAAPPGICSNATPDMDVPVFGERPDDLFARIEAYVAAQRGWHLRDSDAESRQLSCVAITPLLKFKDDVDVQVLELESGEGATLAIYSRSRVGYSDMGANAKRIRKMLGDLTTAEK